MELRYHPAFAYFVRSLIGCFKWSGEEICWTNDLTIAFAPEIVELFKELPAQQLPDFSSIVLCVAAGRKSWPEIRASLNMVIGLGSGYFPEKSPTRLLLNQWPDICKKLDLLNSASQHPTVSQAEKNRLLSIVLSSRDTKYSEENRELILNTLADGSLTDLLPDRESNEEDRRRDFLSGLPLENWSIRFSNTQDIEAGASPLARELLAFLRIASNLARNVPADSVEELISTVRTGLPGVEHVQPAKDVALDPRSSRQQTLDLIQELLNDPELGSVARLTKKLISSISLPRRIDRHEELPIGGISDITNRGELDKLILSELAYDDLTLSVRVALNEALYLRRESPTVHRPTSRWVYVDNSLPMWGIPRVYALSSVLALNATADANTKVRCFSASKKNLLSPKLTEVSLCNRTEILEQFSNLGTSADPSKHLAEFFEQASLDTTVQDPVLVSTADVIQSPQFRLRLDSLWNSNLWIIVVHRSGKLEILKKSPQGFSTYKKIELPLDEILTPPQSSKIQKSDKSVDLPAGVLVRPFPLLLSHQTRADRAWKWQNQVISVSDDGRLMVWREKGRGAYEVMRGLPPSEDCFLIERNPSCISLICASKGESAKLIQLFTNRDLWTRDFKHTLKSFKDIVLLDSHLMIFGTDKEDKPSVCIVDYPNCRHSQTIALGMHFDRCGRCLKLLETKYQALYPIQQGEVFKLGMEKLRTEIPAKQIAEFAGGFVFLDPVGALHMKDGTDPFRSELPTSASRKIFERIVKISTDKTLGEFVIKLGSQSVVIDLTAGNFLMKSNSQYFAKIGDYELSEAQKLISFRVPHYRFHRVGTNGKTLFLQNNRDSFFSLRDDPTCHGAILAKREKANCPMLKFEATVETHGCKLQLAKFVSGTRVWLDWRGLIHLRSHDNDIAEVTLVLRDGAVTGWTSDGDYFGDEYSVPLSKKAMKGDAGWIKFVTPILESML